MSKTREILIAVASLLLLAVIVIVVMVTGFLITQGLMRIGVGYEYFSYVYYVIIGVSTGISLGFGYVIAKRLFDSLFSTERLK
jgi:hypothetical protein